MVALGVGATVMAVPRALSGIVAVPQHVEMGISRSIAAAPSSKPSTAKMPVWAPPTSMSASASDTKAPSAVTGLRLLANTESSVTIAWNPSNDNVAVRLYLVKRVGFSTAQTTSTKAVLSWPRRTGTVTVEVCAVDTSGNQSEWRSLLVTPPTVTATATAAFPVAAPATTPVAQTTAATDTSTSSPPVATSAPASTGAPTTSATVVQSATAAPTSTRVQTSSASTTTAPQSP